MRPPSLLSVVIRPPSLLSHLDRGLDYRSMRLTDPRVSRYRLTPQTVLNKYKKKKAKPQYPSFFISSVLYEERVVYICRLELVTHRRVPSDPLTFFLFTFTTASLGSTQPQLLLVNIFLLISSVAQCHVLYFLVDRFLPVSKNCSVFTSFSLVRNIKAVIMSSLDLLSSSVGWFVNPCSLPFLLLTAGSSPVDLYSMPPLVGLMSEYSRVILTFTNTQFTYLTFVIF